MLNTIVKQTLTVGILAGMAMTTVYAQPSQTPPEFVQDVADDLIAQLKKDQDRLKNPAVVSQIINTKLLPHVDQTAFSRSVLGTYANQASKAQRDQFTVNLRQSLTKNYGSAFAKFTNQTYKLRPYKAPTKAGAYPIVTLDFINGSEKIPVTFQLADKGTTWKVRNINVAGIDMALQFRNQFAATVKRNGNNLDKAIATFNPDADIDKK